MAKKKETKDAEGFIEIPFGAFDSETMGWTYTIPEGFTAKIEDGKIIVEKEGENIRKEIIEFLTYGIWKQSDIDKVKQSQKYAKWVAYLEKQKEQKPAELSEEDIKKIRSNHAAFGGKSAEWSEDYREEDLRTRFAFYTYKDEDGVLYLSNVFVEETSRNKGFGTKILQAAEKVAETIGAITIRLKVKQDSPANAWYRKHGYGYMTFEDGYDWLEKTLEYLKPAKKEWSEEDEKMLNEFIESLRYNHGDGYNRQIAWLKSLHPQPHWKPSEEQMKLLQEAEYALQGKDCHNRFVGFIWDLKKL